MTNMPKISRATVFMPKKMTNFSAITRFYPLLLLLSLSGLSWLLASAIWLVLSPPTAPNLPPLAPLPPKNSSPAVTNPLDIFAKPAAATAPSLPPPDIKIVGVTVANLASNSYAILASGGKTLSYKVGDGIGASQYKLVGVGKDFVTVASPTGQVSKIGFGQKFDLDQSASIHAQALAKMQGANNTAMPPANNAMAGQPSGTGALGINDYQDKMRVRTAQNASGGDASAANNLNNPNLNNNTANGNNPKAAIGGAVTAMQQNPTAYLSNMGLAATGQGYQVTSAMPDTLRNRLGLQAGDKITAVNGQNVGQNSTQDAQALQQVQQSGQAQIQVQRGEQTITVRQSF